MKSTFTSFFFLLLNFTLLSQSPGGISGNLQFWAKASMTVFTDAGITQAVDGQLVQQWNDQTANTNHAIQTVANRRPVYRDNTSDNMNYNPVIEVDNTGTTTTGDYLLAGTTGMPTGNGARSVFFVAVPSGAPETSCLLFIGDYDNVPAGNSGDFVGITLRSGDYKAHMGASRRDDNTTTNTIPGVYGYYFSAGETNVWQLDLRKNSLDLTETNAGSNHLMTSDLGYFTIGAGDIGITTNPIRYWNGYISEACVYNTDITAAQKLRVESYLAIKYGITLDNTAGGTQGDYRSSSNALLWDASLSASYHNDVIGIGRDDASALLQKQSHTIDDLTRIYINSLASNNALNAGTISNDDSYMMIGHDDGARCSTPASVVEIPGTCGLYSRLEREWKVTKSNFSQNFNCDIELDACALPGSVNVAELRLLVDDDGDFSNGGTTCYYNGDGSGIVISYTNPTVTVSNISSGMIPNNSTRYITIGSTNITTPLPVELSGFTAQCTDNGVMLDWFSSSEQDNDFYSIEKSRDGINFESIATLQGNGVTNEGFLYSWIDKNPYQSTAYYRLSQTDFDGKVNLLATVSTNCTENEKLAIYPNPFENNLELRTQIGGQITIIDVSGKIVFEGEVEAGKTTIQTEDLGAGTYFVQFTTQLHAPQIEKIVKR